MNKAQILNAHSISNRIDNGRLMAFDVVCGPGGQDVSVWVDVSDMSRGELFAWLGY